MSLTSVFFPCMARSIFCDSHTAMSDGFRFTWQEVADIEFFLSDL